MENAAGARIRMLREQMGLSVLELANRLGLKRNYVYKLEKGFRGGGPATLENLARELHTTTDYLLGLVDDPNEPDVAGYPVPTPDTYALVARLNAQAPAVRGIIARLVETALALLPQQKQGEQGAVGPMDFDQLIAGLSPIEKANLRRRLATGDDQQAEDSSASST